MAAKDGVKHFLPICPICPTCMQPSVGPKWHNKLRRKAVFAVVAKLPAGVLRWIIFAYQHLLSPFLPQSCRFYPRCSSYCAEALKQYGFCLGLAFGLKRILRCHPWNPGGYDPLPKTGLNLQPWQRGAKARIKRAQINRLKKTKTQKGHAR